MLVKLVAAVLVIINLISFAMMGVDKRRAIRGAWRISERSLITVSACFGALGGTAGMLAFRHKIRDAKFSVGLPIMLVVQLVIAIALFRKLLI